MTIEIDAHKKDGASPRRVIPAIVSLLAGLVISGMLGINDAADRALDPRYANLPNVPTASSDSGPVNVHQRLRIRVPSKRETPEGKVAKAAKTRPDNHVALAQEVVHTPSVPVVAPVLQPVTSTKSKPTKNLRREIAAPIDHLFVSPPKHQNEKSDDRVPNKNEGDARNR
ncbi:MAG: hypothetical protein ABIS18_05510 [Actinomycetota bacterium]